MLAAAAAGCFGASAPTVTPNVSPPSRSRALLQLRRDIDKRLSAPELEHGAWGIVIRSLSKHDLLYERDSRKLMMPASGMKTVTLAVAADRLGWDYTFETRLVADGAVDERFLNGDLIVIGKGDPTLDDWDGAASKLFESWASALKAKGIDTVGGRLIGNDNAMEDAALGAGWAWDDLDRSFATSVGALQFNQNTARVMVVPGAAEAAPASASISPAGNGLTLRNVVKTGAASTPALLQSRRLAGTALLDLRGLIPLGSTPIMRNVSVYNPTQYFLTALRDALILNGIDIRGPAVDIDDVQDAPDGDAGTTVITYQSPTLATIAATMMKQSQNLYAETLISAAGGVEQARAVLETWGIGPADVHIADGSGLSRYNLLTAEALVAILTRVGEQQASRAQFEAALPVAGRDGTLADRMLKTRAEGNVKAKTGSFTNARSLSGYVRAANGETLVFAIIANNYGIPAQAIEDTMDAIAVRLAEFKR
jgi:D-alanyl-D-alanine carboxypeptidase/D-alanyl-D-alanine-endopeptidase (penicillin-binding protein 4)